MHCADLIVVLFIPIRKFGCVHVILKSRAYTTGIIQLIIRSTTEDFAYSNAQDL